MRFLGRYTEVIYTLLRVVAGLMFALHGAAKILGIGGQKVPLASLAGAAGVIELVGGLLIAIGLFTSIAAFIASGEIRVASASRASSVTICSGRTGHAGLRAGSRSR